MEGTSSALLPTESTVGNKGPLPQHLQSAEAAWSLPITSISVAASTAVKLPNVSSLKAEAPSLNKATGVVERSDSSGTMDLDSDTDGASASSEDSEKNGGKTSDDHTSNAASDRKGESSSSALSDAVIADPSKFDVTPAAAPTPGPAADSASMPLTKETVVSGNTTVAVAAPTLKGGNDVDAANVSNGDPQHQSTSIQSAQLVSQVGKSDVTIALQGEQFGAVQLHAKVTGDQVSASITVEHHDTHALLSADLPALHQLLNERQLRVSEITLLHDALSSGGSSEDGSPAKREDTLQQHSNRGLPGNAKEEPFVPSGTNPRNVASGIFDSKGRLSVRA
jgi:flagellar hook-length control protein FliK